MGLLIYPIYIYILILYTKHFFFFKSYVVRKTRPSCLMEKCGIVIIITPYHVLSVKQFFYPILIRAYKTSLIQVIHRSDFFK